MLKIERGVHQFWWGRPFKAAAGLRPGYAILMTVRHAARKRGGSLERLTPPKALDTSLDF
jgi:hypothetical protein